MHHQPDAGARFVWHLARPGRRPVRCGINRLETGFQLVLITGDEVFVTNSVCTLEDAHEASTRWRAALEAKGYRPADPAAR